MNGRVVSGSSSYQLGHYSQPASFATVDPSSSTPRSLNSYKPKYSPYSNDPSGHIIARKRYIILPAGAGQRQNTPGVRYLRQVTDAPEGEQRRCIRTIKLPSSSAVLHNSQNRHSQFSPHSQLSRNTQYVLKIPVIREEGRHFPPQHMSDMKGGNGCMNGLPDHLPIHIPTVPASMSMGAEYTEEELDEQEEADVKYSESGDLTYYQPVINAKEQTMFNCTELDCFWRGSSMSSLRRHMSSVHPPKQVNVMLGNKKIGTAEKPAGKPKGVRCSECDTLAYSRPLLLKHMNHVHGIEAPLINRTFESREELQIWLEELRETHAVEFVVSSGSKKWGYGLQVHYLTCSRSGEQKERPNKKFARPPRPSIKCGKNCMAYLKIKQNPVTSTLQIEGCLYHSGHYIDGSLIQLDTYEQRKVSAIAEQYAQNLIHWDPHNMGAVREILGHSGRFRLIPDASLSALLHQWIKEMHQSESKIALEPVLSYSNAQSTSKFSNDDNFDLLSNNMLLDQYVSEYDADSPASPLRDEIL